MGRPTFVATVLLLAATAARADVTPASLFRDHAVLQQGVRLPIWGAADDGEPVTVEFAGQKKRTVTRGGRWTVWLAPLTPGGPHELTIQGKNRVVIEDVLVGEVWICAGQSNMEMRLGPKPGLQPVTGWKEAADNAALPQIRQFTVERALGFAPQGDVRGEWTVCSPQTVEQFSAVAFFFGRELHRARGVPVGLVLSAWGGTPAESWMSRRALDKFGGFANQLEAAARYQADPIAAAAGHQQRLEAWYRKWDPITSQRGPMGPGAEVHVPGRWEDADLPGWDGVMWFGRNFQLPAGWRGKEAILRLGPVDDADTTWVNGVEVGATHGWDRARQYPIPAGLLREGENSIMVRVLDTGGAGGLWGQPDELCLESPGADLEPVPLAGNWTRWTGGISPKDHPPPRDLTADPNTCSVLFNGMVAPLVPYGVRGVIWYQGESNATRARQYRDLFPALIADWRNAWGGREFPFLFTQIAPHAGMPPELREAQLLTLDRARNTAMVVTIDVGHATDIHPPDKRPIGERLALAARALAYGEKIAHSGPRLKSWKVRERTMELRFSHARGGLAARDGPLRGFALAGPDGVYYPAEAIIRGSSVWLTSPLVPQPKAARYAWAAVAEGNLYNQACLPASPFRTHPSD